MHAGHHLVANGHDGSAIDIVARGACCRNQGIHQRDTGREGRGEGAGEAGHGGHVQYHADHGDGQYELVGVVLDPLGGAPGAHVEKDGERYAAKDHIPPVLHETGDADDELGEDGQLSAKTLEDVLELGNDKQQQDGGNDNGHQDDHGGVEHGFLDLGLECFRFLAIGGDAIVDGLQSAGLLASLHQIAIKIVKVAGMAAQRLGHGRAGLHIGGNLAHELAHGRLLVAASDDLQALDQRYAG